MLTKSNRSKLSKRALKRIKGTSLCSTGKPQGNDKRVQVKGQHGECVTYTPEQIAAYSASL